ncbi:sugar phosphate nucleotidyltransferase, partial [Limosilactobacillus reuteri]
MRPLTYDTPKPLIKVNGKPMIESVIDSLHENDINDITVVVG